MSAPDALLSRPAPEAVRRVAAGYLAKAHEAMAHLRAGDDPEALHDFRVALRRLRSTLRAYDAWVDDTLRARTRRRLRTMARATTVARDLEVHVAWLRAQQRSLARAQRAGARWLLERLQARQAEAERELRRDVLRHWDALHAELGDALGRWTRTVRLDGDAPPASFAAVTAPLLAAHAEELGARLAAARERGSDEALHAARIAGKRLRYLLEPLGAERPEVAPMVARLQELQDALGAVQDAHVFSRELAGAIERAGAERARRLGSDVAHGAGAPPAEGGKDADPDPVPGLLALARRLARQRTSALRALEESWLSDSPPVLEEAAALAAALATESGAVEIERKFLLRGLPLEAAAVPPLVIEQGYLPGTRIVERLRRVREGDTVRCVRTVKDGRGVARIELEEEMDPALFAHLWPLTAGRRVTKERHRVRDGRLVWEVDRFTDRDLVLAEVELHSPDDPVEPPAWLAPYVEREVTGEDAYVNVNLAR